LKSDNAFLKEVVAMLRGYNNLQRLYLFTLLFLVCICFAALWYLSSIIKVNIVLLFVIGIAYTVIGFAGVDMDTAQPGSVVTFQNIGVTVFVFALMVAGPQGVFPILIGSIVTRVLERKWEQPRGYLFNAAQILTSYCVFLAFLYLSGINEPLSLRGVSGALKIISFFLFYLVWYDAFFSLLVSVGSGEPILQVYRKRFRHVSWVSIIPAAMGMLGAMLFAIDPWLVLPAVVPVVLAYYAGARLANMNRELEERVAARTAELQQALRVKDDFVGIAAHELRTPLTSINGALSLVIDGAVAEPPQILRLVQVALTNGERLTRLVNQMLDLQKLEAGTLDINLQPLNLVTIVDQAIAENAGYANTCGVTLTVDHTMPSVPVLANSDRLIQVLTNLFSNACKFSPPGGEVAVTVATQAKMVRVSVHDCGPGIPETFRDRVFEKFAQANTAANRQKGGTGLGLSITKAIVEQLGGRIGFETETNVGTTFFFELPCLSSHDVPLVLDRGLSSGNEVSVSRGNI
jgi:signal transduction histidine kinase